MKKTTFIVTDSRRNMVDVEMSLSSFEFRRTSVNQHTNTEITFIKH